MSVILETKVANQIWRSKFIFREMGETEANERGFYIRIRIYPDNLVFVINYMYLYSHVFLTNTRILSGFIQVISVKI